MSFLAPFLLALSGFAAVPLLLHLIRRKRIRILDFPTFRFLKKAAMQQRVHLRLQDMLLMLLRMLILLMLALAFAGPLTKAQVRGDIPVVGARNVLILDDSLSMAVKTERGTSLYEEAVNHARMIVSRSSGNWTCLVASEIATPPLGPLSTLRGGGTDSPPREAGKDIGIWGGSLEEVLARHPSPGYRGPIGPLVQKVADSLPPDVPVWVLTDAAASDWGGSKRERDDSEASVEILTVGEEIPEANWALRQLVLNNQPLLKDEPALFTASFEAFGADPPGAAPAELEYSWVHAEGKTEEQRFPLDTTSLTQGEIQRPLSVQGVVRSVSAVLVFENGLQDPLPDDDGLLFFPTVLGDFRVAIVTSNPEWSRILVAGLSGFETTVEDPGKPPSPVALQAACYVVLLGNEETSPQWMQFLKSRAEAGAGVLVCYDAIPDGFRQEIWNKWLSFWDTSIEVVSVPETPKTDRAGADGWFTQALDPTARTLDWAESSFVAVRLSGWEVEWLLGPDGGEFVPLFQTSRKGEGVVGSWNVPLSLRNTSLVVTPGWIPLLSQMVKRTLIDPSRMESPEINSSVLLESDLSRLSAEKTEDYRKTGWRFTEAGKVLKDIENLPVNRHDWTMLCLLICLALALAEIGISNYV